MDENILMVRPTRRNGIRRERMSLIRRESKDKRVKVKSIANRKKFPLW